jgi:hypothetical protein
MVSRLFRAAVAATLLTPSVLEAQSGSAQVLPRGTIGVRASGEYVHFDERFRAGAEGREPLGAAFRRPLVGPAFPPLLPLHELLQPLFALPAGDDPARELELQEIALGIPDLSLSVDRRRAVFEAEVGVLPRTSLGVRVPIERTSVSLRSAGLDGANLGINAAVEHNRAVFARISPELEDLGRSRLLPAAGTALGDELQRRVRAILPDDSLHLPSTARGFELVGLLADPALAAAVWDPLETLWRLGDTEIAARFQLVDAVGVGPWGIRSAATAALALRTGEPEAGAVLALEQAAHRHGLRVRLDTDLFAAERIWTAVAVEHRRGTTVEEFRRVAAEPVVFPPAVAARTVRRTTGDLLEILVAPRLRLAEGIYLGSEYRMVRRGAESFGGIAGGEELPWGGLPDRSRETLQQWGVGVWYSAIPGTVAGEPSLPLEAFFTIRRPLTGSAGAAAERAVVAGGRLYVPLRRLRPARAQPEVTAEPAPPPPDTEDRPDPPEPQSDPEPIPTDPPEPRPSPPPPGGGG